MKAVNTQTHLFTETSGDCNFVLADVHDVVLSDLTFKHLITKLLKSKG